MKKYFPLICICLAFALLTVGCSKEEIDIRNVPLNELESSYVVLSKNTIELPFERVDELVIQNDTTVLTLADDELFADLKVGQNVVTSFDTPADQMVFSRILSINRGGGQIICDVENAKPVQVYSEFYIDFSKTNVVQPRSDLLNLETVTSTASATITQIFTNLDKNNVIPFRISPELVLTGTLNAKLAHPHTVWARLFCPYDDKSTCFDTKLFPGIDTDTDQDGIYDDIEDWLTVNNVNDPAVLNHGFHEISFENFGIKKLAFTLSTKKNQNTKIDYTDKPADIANIALLQPKLTDAPELLEANYKYLSAPVFFGPFGVAAVVGPVTKTEIDLKMFAGVQGNFPERLQLVMGYSFFSPSRQEEVTSYSVDFYKDNVRVNPSMLLNNGTIDASVGVSGTIKGDIGLAFGGAITAGVPSGVGGAVGGIVEVTLFQELAGNFGLKAIDIFSESMPVQVGVQGNFCYNMGLKLNAFAFTDANAFGFNIINTFLDNKIALKIPGVLPYQYSFVNALADPSLFPPSVQNFITVTEKKGVCLGTTNLCTDEQGAIADGIIIDDSTLSLDWLFTSSSSSTTYSLNLVAGANTQNLGFFDFNESYGQTFDVDEFFINALATNDTKLVAEPVDKFCTVEQFVTYSLECNEQVFEINSSYTQPENILRSNGGVEYQYMSLNQAFSHCESKGMRLPKLSFVDFHPEQSDCINGTGYLTQSKVNRPDRLYYWVDNEGGPQPWSIAEWEIDGTVTDRTYTYNPEFTNSSSYAPCICVER